MLQMKNVMEQEQSTNTMDLLNIDVAPVLEEGMYNMKLVSVKESRQPWNNEPSIAFTFDYEGYEYIMHITSYKYNEVYRDKVTSARQAITTMSKRAGIAGRNVLNKLIEKAIEIPMWVTKDEDYQSNWLYYYEPSSLVTEETTSTDIKEAF